MKFIKRHYGIVFSLFLIFLFSTYLYMDLHKKRDYQYFLSYFDTHINIHLYNINYKKAQKIYHDLNQIYKKKDRLVNKKQKGEENIYDILYNKKKSETLKIDPSLYQMIDYGLKWHSKSKGLLNINMGEVEDLYERGNIEEDTLSKIDTNIEKVQLQKSSSLKNNHVNLTFRSFILGYVNKEVKEYLKKENIKNYLINAGGNILASNKNYKIALEDTYHKKYYHVLTLKNKALSVKGLTDSYYEINGEKYSKIIHPKTKKTVQNVKSVSVIADDPLLCDTLSTLLFLMGPEEGESFMKDYANIKVIWYKNSGEIVEKMY